MRIETVPVLPAEWLEPAWRFYRDTFDELRIHAVQRQVMHRDEFTDAMTDKRFGKWLATDGDEVVGLAAMTSDLTALPLLSLDYFAHRWPEMYDQQRIFYVTFAAARRGAAGAGVLVRLLGELMVPVGAAGGMGLIDVCTHNEQIRDLPAVIGTALGRIDDRVRTTRLDSQSYWLYEFPVVS